MLGARFVLVIVSTAFFAVMTALAGDVAAQDRARVEIVPQMGHSASVYSVAFSPDGRLALSGSSDNTLKLWDVATGKELRSFSGHTDGVTSVAFSPDGRLALSGSKDETLKLWDVATGKELRSFSGHTSDVRSVAFSPDGRFALSGSWDSTLKLWDVGTGEELHNFSEHRGDVRSVAFSPDGRSALAGGCGERDAQNHCIKSSLKLWDLATGEELRSFRGHTGRITSVAFSPDGRSAVSGGCGEQDAKNDCIKGSLKLWDLVTGEELRSFSGHTNDVSSVAFSPDGRFALSGSDDKTLKLWDVATGKELRSFSGHRSYVASVAFSPDGRFALSDSWDSTLKLWDVATGKELRSFKRHTDAVTSVAFSPDGRFVLSGSAEKTLGLWEAASGKHIHSFPGHTERVNSVVFSSDGRFALSGSNDKTLKLWDVATGKELRSFTGHTDAAHSVAFSPDGRFALSGSRDTTLKLWDVATGKELRSFTGHTGGVTSVTFSPDGRFALSGSSGSDHMAKEDTTLKLWDVATGKELHSFSGHNEPVSSVAFSPGGYFALANGEHNTPALWEAATGKVLRSFTGHNTYPNNSMVFSPDGRFVLSGAHDNTLSLWDVASGKELRRFSGHTDAVSSVAFSPDGRFALSGSSDGTTRIWSVENGQELARRMANADDEWLTMTPEGFFSSSHHDTSLLTIVRGTETTTTGQVHQSLFNPDLVREALAGNPDGEVERAAKVVNLDKVLDAGPPPAAVITSQATDGRSSTDLVTVAARITDRGKGIGRIEWRVNGITAGVMSAPAGPGPDYEVQRQLALDSGENRIEVIAYEGRNLLASLPARTTIIYDGPADMVKSKLHILAIGINAYADQGWTPPGSSEKLAFPPLKLAVADASAFGAEMQKAGTRLYSEVRITQALDADATPAKLDKLLEQMAAGISPRDTFVLYAAAHGYSLNGRYYLIPQDYQGGTNPQALASRAISQERLQDWIANRIKAKKAVILLDTCESGALVGGYTRSRADVPASEAAIGRLHEATGRPVLTAAATGKPAFEGYKGHGVFTYALMEALHRGDANNNGQIEITELAAHVAKRVPELAAEVDKHGVVKGIAVVAMRGANGDKQSAHFGSTGGDFALVQRLPGTLPNVVRDSAIPRNQPDDHQEAPVETRDKPKLTQRESKDEEREEAERRAEAAEAARLVTKTCDPLKNRAESALNSAGTTPETFAQTLGTLREIDKQLPSSCPKEVQIFGGTVVNIIGCINKTVYVQMADGRAFVWSEVTHTLNYGGLPTKYPEKHEYVMGITAEPSYCLTNLLPVTTYPAMHIKTMARRKWHESDREQLNADSARVRASAIAVLDRQISDLDQKIRNDPKDVAAIEARAAAFYSKGGYARAISDYDQLIDLRPRKASAWRRRCWVRAVANIDLDRAIADCNESLKLEPNNADAFASRAAAFQKKGDHARAIADYDQLTALQPENAVAWNYRCWARAIANRGLRQAIADCNVSLGLESRSALTLDSRGFAYLRLGEFDQSITDYNAALRIDSRLAASLYGRGLAKLKKGDIAGGDADVAAAREIDAHVVEEFASYGVK